MEIIYILIIFKAFSLRAKTDLYGSYNWIKFMWTWKLFTITWRYYCLYLLLTNGSQNITLIIIRLTKVYNFLSSWSSIKLSSMTYEHTNIFFGICYTWRSILKKKITVIRHFQKSWHFCSWKTLIKKLFYVLKSKIENKNHHK